MKLSLQQLEPRLRRELLPVWVLTGDEPLQMEEGADAIRAAARQAGYTEREVHHVERGFDWNGLSASAGSLSLFGDRKLVEIRLRSGTPGDAGSRALRAWAENPPADTLLLLILPKVDKRTLSTAWMKALDRVGAVVQVWPVEGKALLAWIRTRMLAADLQPAPEAVRLLAERVEGNLLAAAQEIEKLRLLTGGGRVEAETVARAVADSARFDIFGLVDTALAGEAGRCVRILDGLRAEGVAPPLVLWAFVREIRSLAGISSRIAAGERLDPVLRAARVWDKRRPAVLHALHTHRGPRAWQRLLRLAARAERVIKGAEPGNPWDELVQLGLSLAGRPPLASHRRVS